ncbi:MAG TPA: PEGA domain-containing protein [Polyangiales bacterium]|nr:PEGA domain-containing protein [Polyangiales bacterium]
MSGGFLTTTGFAQEVAAGTADATPSGYDAFIEQAIQAYDGGRWAEARSLFRRAHDLMPTARTLRTMGMCSFNLGDYLDAVANLEAALQDSRKPLNPEQRASASDLIARSQAHVGRFRLRLTPEDAVVWVDGRPPLRLGSGEVLLEPGRHEVSVQASGYQTNRSTLQVEGGDRTTLEIRLEASSPQSAVVATAAVEPIAGTSPQPAEPAPAPAAHGNTQAVLGYVSLGLAGASLIAFGISTGMASSKASSLEDNCSDNACGPNYHDDVDTYDRLKVISTVSLITTGVFAALGTVLLVTSPSDNRERASIQPMIGPGSLGIRGQL